jgi:hypothetical protein
LHCEHIFLVCVALPGEFFLADFLDDLGELTVDLEVKVNMVSEEVSVYDFASTFGFTVIERLILDNLDTDLGAIEEIDVSQENSIIDESSVFDLEFACSIIEIFAF